MLNLPVDEAYAFDYLSILQLKFEKDPSNPVKLESFKRCLLSIDGQLDGRMNFILSSQEYDRLLKANNKTFDAVNLAKKNEITAKEVDDLNMERFYSKRDLQAKFFGGELKEIKTSA